MIPPQLSSQQFLSQKGQLVHKLFLLEHAKRKLDQELSIFINKAYEDVQSFLNASAPTGLFSDLVNALDTKCRTVDELSASLKDLSVEPRDSLQPIVNIAMRTGRPPLQEGILMTDVLKFGPMLQNVLLASSIAKAVQVVGGALSLQQLKHFLISQPAASWEDDMIHSVSSDDNSSIQTKGQSCHSQGDGENVAVIYEEKSQPDDVILPPAIVQRPKTPTERPPPPLLPPIQAVLPEMSKPTPTKTTALISWGWEDNVQVQSAKQTSFQLLNFFRSNAKSLGALEVTVMEWNENVHASCSPQSTSPTIKALSNQFINVLKDDLIKASALKTTRADVDNQAPVFRVKRVESNGSLTYTCMIMTKTELWDIADVFTEVQQPESDSDPEKESVCEDITAQAENSSVNKQWKSQTQSTEPESGMNSAFAETPVINSVAIPEFQIRTFEETEVVVSHVISPGNFHIQHADALTKLQALDADSWKASSSCAEQNCIPDIGTQVMGWFPKHRQWCRAQVTKICGVSGDYSNEGETSIKMELKRLDHGDTASLSLSNIRQLTTEMTVLPLQALEVSLANVTPVSGTDWSEEAVGWFKAIVHNRVLYARLFPKGPKVTVELFLEKGKLGAMRRGASLSLRLAQNGHAKHSRLKNVGFIKRRAVEVHGNSQDSEWKKYLISCYSQNNI